MCEMRRRGVAAAAICSEPFSQLARTQAAILGVPDLSLIVIPHPLGGATREEVRRRADVAFPQLLQLLQGFRQ
jgi:hypothetical protein